VTRGVADHFTTVVLRMPKRIITRSTVVITLRVMILLGVLKQLMVAAFVRMRATHPAFSRMRLPSTARPFTKRRQRRTRRVGRSAGVVLTITVSPWLTTRSFK